MENNLQVFENEEFGKIRVVEIDEQTWFVGKDVAKVLGYENTSRDVNRHVDEEDKGVTEMVTPGGKQKIIVINESGLYSLILSSKLPAAKKFKRWVTSEVLPSIRKHGAYIKDELLEAMADNAEFTQKIIMQMAEERGKNKSLKLKNEVLLDCVCELAPKARYCDIILQCPDAIQTSIVAKDYGMTCVSFNKLLQGLGVQYKIGDTWLLRQKYASMGYTISKTYQVNYKKSSIHTYWTQAGRQFLYDFLKGYEILPEAEIYTVV